MTKEELIKRLREIESVNVNYDYVHNHVVADDLLLEFINDPEIKNAYDEIVKYYENN